MLLVHQPLNTCTCIICVSEHFSSMSWLAHPLLWLEVVVLLNTTAMICKLTCHHRSVIRQKWVKYTLYCFSYVHHNLNEIYNSSINKLPAATHCFQYHLLSLQSRGTTLLAGYFLHVSSAPHQKQLISSTQSPQDVLLCGQVKAGVVVGATVVHVPLLFVVTVAGVVEGATVVHAPLLFVVTVAAVAVGHELFKLVKEYGVFVVVVELLPATTLRNKQIQKTNVSTMFFMLTGLRCWLTGNGKMKKKTRSKTSSFPTVGKFECLKWNLQFKWW